MNTQIARQTTFNEYINAAVQSFLDSHPDTELTTVENAMRDAMADAEAIYKDAKR